MMVIACRTPGDQMAEGKPPSRQQNPDDVAQDRAGAGVPAPHGLTPERPQGKRGQHERLQAERLPICRILHVSPLVASRPRQDSNLRPTA